MKLFASFLLVTCFVTGNLALEWWENANYYQIYPKSYADANNDGTGDLAGIQSKIPYLKELGMDAVWLSPIFKSSWKDGGYDISDFRAIDPVFGTMKDFESLLATCKEHGIKLILDFVPNHSSNECEWFLKSERKEAGFEDFYIWHPGKPQGSGQPLPPNNWNSVFRGSAWEWSDVRKEYYLHQFAIAQPDLNYRSENVVKEMKSVLKFWLDKGVDGFRVDAIPHLFEVEKDKDGNYPDEPLSGDCTDDSLKHCYLSHIYTQNYPETYDMVYQWREVLDTYKDSPRLMMTEAYTPLENIMKYFGDGKKNGSHIPFNFEVLTSTSATSTAKQLKITSENYMNHLPAGRFGNWVLGNHDQRRIKSRLGGEARAEVFNFFLQTMPGHAITYQGEEIIMEDVHISWAETQDPQACNTNSTVYDEYSRDPARTPMQWNNSTNAGFNNGTKTWLPVGSNYKTLNVALQESAENSHLKIFKKLVQLHKLPAFREGLYESANNLDENVYSYIRTHGEESYLVALNLAKQNKTINFGNVFRHLKPSGEVVLSSLNSKIAEKTKIVMHDNVVLSPESALVVKMNGASTLIVSTIALLATVVMTFFNNFMN